MAKRLDDMYPSEIVTSLDKYVIGQEEAKKMVAIAIRNRSRRKKLPDEIREEVNPKNIMMIGPTGVGKTEIARRIAKLANAPFVKVEATKFTEVGYVGRDVESMVKDLMAMAVNMVSAEMAEMKSSDVDRLVDERLLDLLLPTITEKKSSDNDTAVISAEDSTREQFRDLLHKGVFDDKMVEITSQGGPKVEVGFMGTPSSMDDIQDAMSNISSLFQRPRRRRVSIKRAREIFREEEMAKVVDQDKAVEEARQRTEQMGIIFIDEIDKIASGSRTNGADVSREGVQRDILPIVEGTKVNTKWGVVDTTNILFIASGAFSMSKPSDLIPELQGRFPIRVELKALTADDFYRILTEPTNALTKQYEALLGVDDVKLDFTEDGLRRIAELAWSVNNDTDNIGARRLHTIMEKLVEEVSYNADQMRGQTVVIDRGYVDRQVGEVASSRDASRYIL